MNVSRQRMERLFQHNKRLFQNNKWSDCLHKGMERNNRFNTTKRNNRFNTTEWNGTIILTQWNRMERWFYHNGTERNGNGRSVARYTNGNFLSTPTVFEEIQYKMRPYEFKV